MPSPPLLVRGTIRHVAHNKNDLAAIGRVVGAIQDLAGVETRTKDPTLRAALHLLRFVGAYLAGELPSVRPPIEHWIYAANERRRVEDAAAAKPRIIPMWDVMRGDPRGAQSAKGKAHALGEAVRSVMRTYSNVRNHPTEDRSDDLTSEERADLFLETVQGTVFAAAPREKVLAAFEAHTAPGKRRIGVEGVMRKISDAARARIGDAALKAAAKKKRP